jgi:glycosyltransferase involved in cell wall biosynthesis
MPTLSVIVPVFNEKDSVKTVLDQLAAKKIPGVEMEIIVVESNSTDGTRDIVRGFEGRPGFKVLYEARPSGKGHGVRTGLATASGDIILIQDADLEYSLDDYGKLLEPILAGKAEFVLGTRHTGDNLHIRKFTTGNHIAVLFNFSHWLFTAVLNATLGTRMTDPFTMFKVFRRSCLAKISPLECNRFDLDWEIVMKLVHAGYAPLEIPISYRSRDYKEGKKISMAKDPPTWLRAWWKYGVLKK